MRTFSGLLEVLPSMSVFTCTTKLSKSAPCENTPCESVNQRKLLFTLYFDVIHFFPVTITNDHVGLQGKYSEQLVLKSILVS